ncbi:hypothetical protein Tco_1235662, partial [Tanacetum coccineum]
HDSRAAILDELMVVDDEKIKVVERERLGDIILSIDNSNVNNQEIEPANIISNNKPYRRPYVAFLSDKQYRCGHFEKSLKIHQQWPLQSNKLIL